jgi:hypothetical protein
MMLPQSRISFPRLVSGALGLAFGLALAPLAAADIVHLKNGQKVEGEIVERNDQKVVVKTKFGNMDLKAADISRIEEKNTPAQEMKARRAAIDATDPDQLFDLYLYAKGENLKAEAASILREIVKLDPDHGAARKALGHVKHKDKWVTEAEAKKLGRTELEAEMKAKGLVEYKGEWLTPEEKSAKEHEARGEVLVDGKWVNKKDLERVEAERKLRDEMVERRRNGEFHVNGKWMPKAEAEKFYSNLDTPYRVMGEHVMLITNKGIDLGDRVSVAAEAAYRDAAAFFGAEPEMGGRLMPVYVTATLEELNQLATVANVDEKSGDGGYSAWSTPWLANHSENFDMFSATMYYQDVVTDIYARHAVVDQFVRRLSKKDASELPPRWFVDGVASYLERWKTPANFKWSRERLKMLGALGALKTLLGSYQVKEPSILQMGALMAFTQSAACPEDVKTKLAAAKEALVKGGKVGKAFKDLENALIESEEAFFDFVENANP